MSDHKSHRTEISDHVDGYDATYCVDCNEWLTPKCSDSSCMFCAHRPEKPLPEQKNLVAIEADRSTRAALAAAAAGTYDPEKEY